MKKFAIRRCASEDEKEKLRVEILKIVLGNTHQKEENSGMQDKICKISKSFTEKFGLKSELKNTGNNKGKFTVLFSSEEEKNKLINLLEQLS